MSRGLFILHVLLLVTVASTGYAVMEGVRHEDLSAGATASNGASCAGQPKREFSHSPYYTGILFDAHLHLPSSSSVVSSISTRMGLPTSAWGDTLSYEYLACILRSEGTRGAFGFHLLTRYSLSGEVGAAKALDKKKSGVAHFLMPTFVNRSIDPSVESVRKLVDKNPDLFKGIGELKFFDQTSPDSPKVHPYYQLAEKHGLIVMIHPFDDQKDATIKVIRQYPKVTFLLHGIDSEGSRPGDSGEDNVGWVLNLLRTYHNVYYSVDDAPIWQIQPRGEKIDRDTAIGHLRSDFNTELDRLTRRWKTGIESFPDRILSGTDRWYDWHYDREASALIVEFKRAFIGRLSPEVREQYAYKNAEKLLASVKTP